jgi:hypothetical protein
LFEPYRALTGFEIAYKDEATRLLLEESGYLPIQLTDVMLGPFKFQNSAVKEIGSHV